MSDSMLGDTAQYIMVIEYDLSLTTGYSINERESAVALLDGFGDRLRIVAPAPAFPEVFRDDRISYIRNHNRHHPFYYVRFLYALRRQVREMQEERPADAIVFRLGPFPIAPALAIRAGARVILKRLSGYSQFAREGGSPLQRVIGSSAVPLYRYIAARSLGADVESHAFVEWLPEKVPISRSRLFIVPNGANTDIFRPQGRTEAKKAFGWERFDHLVGYVGAIEQLRCIESLVVAAEFLKDVPRLGIVLVGGGPQVEMIRTQIEARGLHDRVLLAGFLPYTDVPRAMSAFDVAVDLTRVPLSTGDRTHFGSYSQKIAQYLATGVPVVAWDTPDTTFLDREGVGRTVPIGHAERVAEAIRDLVSAGPERVAMQSRCRTHAIEHLSAPQIARLRMSVWDALARAEARDEPPPSPGTKPGSQPVTPS